MILFLLVASLLGLIAGGPFPSQPASFSNLIECADRQSRYQCAGDPCSGLQCVGARCVSTNCKTARFPENDRFVIPCKPQWIENSTGNVVNFRCPTKQALIVNGQGTPSKWPADCPARLQSAAFCYNADIPSFMFKRNWYCCCGRLFYNRAYAQCMLADNQADFDTFKFLQYCKNLGTAEPDFNECSK